MRVEGSSWIVIILRSHPRTMCTFRKKYPIPPGKYKWKHGMFYVYGRKKTIQRFWKVTGGSWAARDLKTKINREIRLPRLEAELWFTEKPILVQLNKCCALVNEESGLTDISHDGLRWCSWWPLVLTMLNYSPTARSWSEWSRCA